MAHSKYQIQIVDKHDFTKQVVVDLPDNYQLPTLREDEVRIQSRILSLTSNTITYARIGHLFGCWSVWPTLTSMPAPYNDSSKYGRISSWGYAEVIESRHGKVPLGTKLFGYLPIGSHPEIMVVHVDPETGHVLEQSAGRQDQSPFYNRYLVYGPDLDLVAERDARAWDAAMQVLFETSYLLNRHGLSWDDSHRTHPLGSTEQQWTEGDADIAGATVILLAASGKTGLAFAHQLRHTRPPSQQPKRIIAVGSAASRAFSQGTGLFDDVALYSDATTGSLLGIDSSAKVVIVNFGARADADFEWFEAAKKATHGGSVRLIYVGGDPTARVRSKLMDLADVPESGVYRAFAPGMRSAAMASLGQKAYFDEMMRAWAGYKDGEIMEKFNLKWESGMGAIKDGWDALCRGEIGPDACLVYELTS